MTRPPASLLLLALAAPAQAAEAEACLVNRLPVPATASFHGVSSQEGSVKGKWWGRKRVTVSSP